MCILLRDFNVLSFPICRLCGGVGLCNVVWKRGCTSSDHTNGGAAKGYGERNVLRVSGAIEEMTKNIATRANIDAVF